MVYTTGAINARENFMKKRIIRIIPLYWLITLCYYIVLSIVPQISPLNIAEPEYLIKSMMFIPYKNNLEYGRPLVGVGWTLNYEMFFYIIFAIAMWINHKNRVLISALFVGVIVAVGYMMQFPYAIQYYSRPFLLEFVLGMVSYYIVECLKKYNRNVLITILLMASCVFFSLIIILDISINPNIKGILRSGIPAMLFFISFIPLTRDRPMPKWMVKLGNMSYSFYLIECVTTAIYKALFASSGTYIKIIGVIVTLFFTFVISAVSYEFIEKRFTKIILNKIYSQGTL
jgi:peptidoglycan/LPS O-acetylase OafA/YrhL